MIHPMTYLNNKLISKRDKSISEQTDFRNKSCCCCMEEKIINDFNKCDHCGVITCDDCSKEKWELICPHCGQLRHKQKKFQKCFKFNRPSRKCAVFLSSILFVLIFCVFLSMLIMIYNCKNISFDGLW